MNPLGKSKIPYKMEDWKNGRIGRKRILSFRLSPFDREGEHPMMQRMAIIVTIFVFVVLVIAGCKNTASQKQTAEVNPNMATEQVTLKVDGMT